MKITPKKTLKFLDKIKIKLVLWLLNVSILLTLILSIPLNCPINAQTPEAIGQATGVSSSWNPVGSGARALGIGGAFIAVADDATAASWNPGGLIQLEKPEISIVVSYRYRKEDNAFVIKPEESESQSTSFSDLNFLSLAYPFSLLNRNMVVSFTYQNLFDFNREAKFSLSQDDGTLFIDRKLDFQNDGNLSAVGLAYCVGLTQDFSLGLTFNFWEDWLGNHGWKEIIQESATGRLALEESLFPPIDILLNSTIKKDYSFSGFNANFGFLWRVTSNFTLGGVLKTPFTAELNVETKQTLLVQSGNDPELTNTIKSQEDLDLEMPLSYGIGLSYRFSDALTVAADIYRTEWDDFLFKRPSGKTSPITGLSKSDSDIDPTTQVRIGGEYLFINPQYVIPLRVGLFYDPAPAIGSPNDIYGTTIGSGIAWKGLIIDIAYQYRWGNNLESSISSTDNAGSSIKKGEYDLKEHTIYSSLIFHF